MARPVCIRKSLAPRRSDRVLGFSEAMRRLLTVLGLILVCTSVRAMSPEYFSSRKWVEERCSTNQIPEKDRIFVGRPSPGYAAIVHFRKGITLREIIDQTPFKGTVLTVCVLRPHTDPSKHLFRKVLPTDKPSLEINQEDMIWLYEYSTTPLW
jgi:hypothetical protein